MGKTHTSPPRAPAAPLEPLEGAEGASRGTTRARGFTALSASAGRHDQRSSYERMSASSGTT